jgi:hypothetical protein
MRSSSDERCVEICIRRAITVNPGKIRDLLGMKKQIVKALNKIPRADESRGTCGRENAPTNANRNQNSAKKSRDEGTLQ